MTVGCDIARYKRILYNMLYNYRTTINPLPTSGPDLNIGYVKSLMQLADIFFVHAEEQK